MPTIIDSIMIDKSSTDIGMCNLPLGNNSMRLQFLHNKNSINLFDITVQMYRTIFVIGLLYLWPEASHWIGVEYLPINSVRVAVLYTLKVNNSVASLTFN